jgi:cystathionine beta-lyase
MSLDNFTAADLRDGYSVKWHLYPEDVLAMWVADMDFMPSPKIAQAIARRLKSRIGYPLMGGDPKLLELLIGEQAGYGLRGLSPDNLWLLSSVVPGIYASVLGLTSPGDEIITQVPVYHPFLYAIGDYGRVPKHNPMVLSSGRWQIDFDQLESLVTPASRLLMLCNPQNPTGRVFERSELEQLAEFVLKHRLWVMSDELHAKLIFDGKHIPFASISPEIAQRTVTLTGPCKAYNTAGLGGGVAISHNKEILARMQKATKGVGGHPNVLSMAAWAAAIEEGGDWLHQAAAYLRSNRDFLTSFLRERLPEVGYVPAEGTYLAFMDFRKFPFADSIHKFLLEEAKVGLNDGIIFGPQYQGFVRLNFATSRAILTEALERIEQAVAKVD